MKALMFGLACGAAIQAWRNFPADGPLSSSSAMVLAGLGMIAAFLAGRSRRPGASIAVATASAEATAVASNQVNVAVVVPGAGAGSSSVPTAVMPWLEARPAVELDQLDGMAVEDLMSVADYERTSEGLES